MSVTGLKKQQNETKDEKPLSPVANIHSNSSRFSQPIVDQHGSIGTVEFGHLNGVSAFVTPVQVSSDPVHCQTVRVTERGTV